MLTFIAILVPLISGLSILKLNFKNKKDRERYFLLMSFITLILVMGANALHYNEKFVLANFPFGIEFAFRVDGLSLIFSSMFVVIWFLVGIYSLDYMSHAGEENRFYTYYLSIIGALVALSYSANLVTLYMCFEIMSILGYVLVIHERSNKAFLAGRKYIYYSLFGAGVGLIGIFYAYSLNIDQSFTQGGIMALREGASNEGILIFTLIAILGFSVKAGMFPLHGWLPVAHPVAPAPASAILSGLITKSGILAIIRILYYVVGVDILRGSYVQKTVLVLSMLTILMGSLLAYREKGIKKRLAYSTVSQVSYVIFGLFLFNAFGFIGAILQVVFHALAKNLLFMGAGAIIYKTHITTVDKLIGLGNSMKSTFILFTIGGMSLVGIPFTAGFVSKWYLAQGALNTNDFSLGIVGLIIIMISALLTAGYLLKITAVAFFEKRESMAKDKIDLPKTVTYPMGILACIIIVLGVFPQELFNFIMTISSSLGL
ncbi:MAG: complex I subunit 5 family protein [Clostridium sp.]